jgi:hypothetical protein
MDSHRSWTYRLHPRGPQGLVVLVRQHRLPSTLHAFRMPMGGVMTAAYVLAFGLCAAIVLAGVLLARYDQHRRRAIEADWARHEAEALAVANEIEAGS